MFWMVYVFYGCGSMDNVIEFDILPLVNEKYLYNILVLSLILN